MFRLPVIPILVLLPFGASAQTVHDHRDQPAPPAFAERVNAYMEIHHRLAAALGPDILCSDPELLILQQQRFAAGIREERGSAATASVFTPAVASFFRERIQHVLREHSSAVDWVQQAADDDAHADGDALEAGDAFPWAHGSVMWPGLLWRLPALPPELEYRVVGRTLALVDVRAGLTVDVLPDALPLPSPAPSVERPCEAHPRLPACWM